MGGITSDEYKRALATLFTQARRRGAQADMQADMLAEELLKRAGHHRGLPRKRGARK